MAYQGRWASYRARVVAVLALAVLSVPAPASSAEQGTSVAAEINGLPLARATEARPLVLHPERPANVSLRMRNRGAAAVQVRTVRLEGTVMGLTFFAYETATSLSISPGATETLGFSLDIRDLDGQATGLTHGSVRLLDADREPIAREETVFDVRGSLRSVYGVFGVAVAMLTLVSFGGVLLALARHKLPRNRLRRALRFVTPGVGLGLSLVFTLSAVRVFVPRPDRWVPILVVSVLVLVGLGFLTPSPEDEHDEDFEDLTVPAGKSGDNDGT